MSEPNGLIYNCGTFKVDNLDIRNNTTKLVNQGKAYIEETHTRCTIENGCYLEVEDFDGVLRLGELSSATIETYNKNRGDNPDLTLGKNCIFNRRTLPRPFKRICIGKNRRGRTVKQLPVSR